MKCIARGCRRDQSSRGLCLPCYSACHRKVVKGDVTWKELEDEGVCLPARPPNPTAERLKRRKKK